MTPTILARGKYCRFVMNELINIYCIFLSYAFVTYDSSDDATDATEKMNGTTIFGQQIKVNVARPKEGGGGGGGGGFGGRGG